VLAPEDQELWLRRLHPCLPLWIGLDISAIVKEEVALNLCLPWRIWKCVFIGPKVRIIQLNLRIISDMARPRCRERQQVLAQRFFMRRPILPECPPRCPARAQSFVMRHRVLNNKSLNAIWMLQGHAKAYRAAVILHVKYEARKPDCFGEVIHDGSINLGSVGGSNRFCIVVGSTITCLVSSFEVEAGCAMINKLHRNRGLEGRCFMREQNSATTMNRREMLKLSMAAALIGTTTIPDKTQAMQTVSMKAISLPLFAQTAAEAVGGCHVEAFFLALCRLKFAPAEPPSLFFTKATDHRCSFCMDTPKLTLPGTKWRRDSPSGSRHGQSCIVLRAKSPRADQLGVIP